MKKIGIITYHSIPNHGGMLQMYGLCEIMKELGESPIIILHEKRSWNNSNVPQTGILEKIKRYTKIDNWRLKINSLKQKGFDMKKMEEILKFQENHFETSEDIDACEKLCIGSDEVFSIKTGFTPEFFGENIDKPFFSYAGSFGQTDIALIEKYGLTNRLKEDFLQFERISVRDENSANTIKELIGVDVPIHIDPVLLYGYKEIVDSTSHNIEDTLILYSYNASMCRGKDISSIKKVAKKRKVGILSAGFYHYWCNQSINYSPLEMIEKFCKSKYVITDTFHGAVISIITHTQFVVLVREDFNSNKICGLLDLLELRDRLANNVDDIDKIIDKPIDFEKVEKKLDEYRDEARKYLSYCLSEVQNESNRTM